MQKVTITKINRQDRVSQRTGKSFTSVGIQTQEHGDKWLSGFEDNSTKYWVEGKEVMINVERKMSADGSREFLNFKPVTKTQVLEQKMAEMERRVSVLENKNGITSATAPVVPNPVNAAPSQPASMAPENNTDEAYQEMVDSLNPDDIPF
jgi:hypothetical protein